MKDLELAKMIAEKFHYGQSYDKFPYMKHLEEVCESVSSQPNKRLQVVAILQDILEDTSCSPELLFQLFEDNIVHAVIALTKKQDQTREAYIEDVKKNPLALTVKIHDTLCNLTNSVKRYDEKRIDKYSKQLQELIK